EQPDDDRVRRRLVDDDQDGDHVQPVADGADELAPEEERERTVRQQPPIRRDRVHLAPTASPSVSAGARSGRATLVDDGVALLAKELGDVVHRQAGLARRAGALPTTEGLD